MKVKDLIEALLKEDPEKLVVLQKDSEGNGYSPIAGCDGNGVYAKDHEYITDYEVYDSRWSAEDADMTEEDWEKFKKGNKCVVLWPVN